LWPESLGVAASLGVCAWQSGGHGERHDGGMQTRVTSVAQDTDDRRQRQDEALYSRALESIDLQCTAQCTDASGSLGRGLHCLSFRNKKSATPPLNEPWERLCAHLYKQCHCIRSVTQQAFKHRLLWLYLPANACAARVQAHPQKLSTSAVRSCTSSMTCRRCTFSAGQQLQQRQQPQVVFCCCSLHQMQA